MLPKPPASVPPDLSTCLAHPGCSAERHRAPGSRRRPARASSTLKRTDPHGLTGSTPRRPALHKCSDCGWSLAGAGTRNGISLARAALGLVWTGRKHQALPSSVRGTTIREHRRRERMRGCLRGLVSISGHLVPQGGVALGQRRNGTVCAQTDLARWENFGEPESRDDATPVCPSAVPFGAPGAARSAAWYRSRACVVTRRHFPATGGQPTCEPRILRPKTGP